MLTRRTDYIRALVLFALCSVPLLAQFDEPVSTWRSDSEFAFVRLIYESDFVRLVGRGGGGWIADWPDAEYHFMRGVQRLTSVDAAGEGRYMTALDEELFDYPWLYVVEVGFWKLSTEEVENLREYLLRGGFLMVDDFHGSYQWAGFIAFMSHIFPNRAIVDIPADHESMHVLYDLDKRQQIPGVRALWQGQTHEGDGVTPHWRGIYDNHGRLMVAINHNMDIGDAWEHADSPGYPEPMTALAYRFGINYVIYAMTH